MTIAAVNRCPTTPDLLRDHARTLDRLADLLDGLTGDEETWAPDGPGSLTWRAIAELRAAGDRATFAAAQLRREARERLEVV